VTRIPAASFGVRVGQPGLVQQAVEAGRRKMQRWGRTVARPAHQPLAEGRGRHSGSAATTAKHLASVPDSSRSLARRRRTTIRAIVCMTCGVLRDDFVEGLPGDVHQLAVAHRHHGRRPGFAGEERDLSDALAPGHLAQHPTVGATARSRRRRTK